jgi:hypothetical protein
MKQRLKKYIELEKKISGWGWNQEEEKVDAPDAIFSTQRQQKALRLLSAQFLQV